jgi:hypothetical protein
LLILFFVIVIATCFLPQQVSPGFAYKYSKYHEGHMAVECMRMKMHVWQRRLAPR